MKKFKGLPVFFKMSSNSEKKISEYKLTEVISIVSHQLKTPLAGIKGYLEVLISEDLGKLNEKQKEYLKDTLENTQRMIGLVKDLLDVSKIEEGRLEIKPRPASLEEIVKDVIKEFSVLARARNCEIVFKANGRIPLLNIDSLKIKQVVNNIIANSLEYNVGKGSAQVSLQKEGTNLVFRCQDNGIGIPKEEQPKIFRKFYRNEKAVSLSPGGSGLGLFISKAIIEKSGGKIWFESKDKQGTTFCFSLPVKKY